MYVIRGESANIRYAACKTVRKYRHFFGPVPTYRHSQKMFDAGVSLLGVGPPGILIDRLHAVGGRLVAKFADRERGGGLTRWVYQTVRREAQRVFRRSRSDLSGWEV